MRTCGSRASENGEALGLALAEQEAGMIRRVQMTDLDRLGLALVGFAVSVVVGGVLLGLIGRLVKGGKL